MAEVTGGREPTAVAMATEEVEKREGGGRVALKEVADEAVGWAERAGQVEGVIWVVVVEGLRVEAAGGAGMLLGPLAAQEEVEEMGEPRERSA